MLNLGSINFNLGVTTAGLGAAGQAITSFGQKITGTMTKAKQDMDSSVTSGFKAISQAAALTVGPLDGLTFRLRTVTGMVSEYGAASGIAAAAVLGFGAAVAIIGTQLVSTIIDYQKAEMALRGITDSTSIAKAELGYLRDVATQAGLSFTGIAPSFSRFVSSATGVGQSLSVTNDEFKKFTLIAGTLHLTTEEVNNVMRAFDQMLSMGTVNMKEMRQLFNNFPAVFEIASKAAAAMGLKLQDALKQGTVPASKFIQGFVDQAMVMFHIDLSKPIDTLQASLTRIQTSWQGFLLNLNTALAASDQLKNLFKDLSGGIDSLGNHMQTFLGIVGAVSGALLGLFAVLALNAALSAFASLIGPLVVFIGNFVQALALARDATELLTAAQIGLDVAMTANPIGAVVVGLTALVAAIGGAKFMYDKFNVAINVNQAAFSDVSSINTYIAKQQELGKNVASVTEQMQKQIQTMAVANDAQLATASQAYLKAKSDFDSISKIMSQPGNRGLTNENLFANAQRDMLAKGTALTQLTETGGKLMVASANLSKLSVLPEDTTLGKGNVKTPKTPDPDRGLRNMDALINKAQDAQKALSLMWQGPATSTLLDSLEEAKQKLFDLKPDQLKALTELLYKGGINVQAMGGLTGALTDVIVKTKLASETAKEFAAIWTTVTKGQITISELAKQIDYLRAGGDPEQMWVVQASLKASEALRKLTISDLPALRNTLENMSDSKGNKIFGAGAISDIMGAASSDRNAGLEAVHKALNGMGFAGNDAQESMTNFFKALDGGSETLKHTEAMMKELRTGFDELTSSRAQLATIGSGASLDKLLNVTNLQKATVALRELSADDLSSVVRQLDALGISGETASEKLANFWKTQDRNKEAIADYTALLNQQQQAWVDFSNNSVDALYGLVTGTQNASTALKTILGDLAKAILESTIVDPLKAGLTRGIKNLFSGATNGSTNPADANNANSISLLGNAASQAANALGLNFVGSLLQSVGINALAGSSKGAEAAATTAATAALIAFTTAVGAATVASGASSASSFFEAAAAAAVLVSTGGYVRKFGAGGFTGLVNGPGTGTSDSIPAMISNKEFVMNAASTAKFLPFLFQMNKGILPHFAVGGLADMSSANSNMAPANSNSLLIGPQNQSIIDARSTFNIQGNVDSDTFEQMKAYADQRDAQLRAEIPYMVDARVPDSIQRGRYGSR